MTIDQIIQLINKMTESGSVGMSLITSPILLGSDKFRSCINKEI